MATIQKSAFRQLPVYPACHNQIINLDNRADHRNAQTREQLSQYRAAQNTEIGRAHVELQSLMRISYAVFCLKKKTTTLDQKKTEIKKPESIIDNNYTTKKHN